MELLTQRRAEAHERSGANRDAPHALRFTMIRYAGLGARRIMAAVCLALAFTFAPARAASSTPPAGATAEYRVKAAFLFNFAQFVQWPAQAFPDEQSPLVIGVWGENPFGDYLEQLTAGEKIGERAILVKLLGKVEEAQECQIVFIARSETAQMDRVLAQLNGRSVLTVSDAESFNRRGGMIRFVTEGGKIRFRINVNAAKTAGLVISSKLLRAAGAAREKE